MILFCSSHHFISEMENLRGMNSLLKNYIIFPEYEGGDGEREIHAAIAIYRNNLIKEINDCATKKGIIVREIKN